MFVHKTKLQDTYGSLEWKTDRLLKFEDFVSLGVRSYQTIQT